MPDLLHYGTNSKLATPKALDRNWTIAPLPKGAPLADLHKATQAALVDPLDFPPLEKALLAEDHMAIVLEPGVPRASDVIAAVVEAVLAIGTNPEQVTVVCDPRTIDDPRSGLTKKLQASVKLDRHDAANHDRVEFLTSNRKGRAVYLNRSICDAEVVLSVGPTRSTTKNGDLGLFGGLYPVFSEADTQKRFRNPALLDRSSPLIDRARHEVAQVGWLSGAVFAVQVIPAGGDQALAVLAGHPETVARQTQQRYEQAWTFEPRGRAELVVAGIGGTESQTWEQLAAAVSSVIDAVEEDGTLVLCSEVSAQPGSGVQRLGARQRPDQVIKRLETDRPLDTLTAITFAQARERVKLYLLSQVDRDSIDRLGIEPLDGPDEVLRLMQRHSSCLIVPQAPFAVLNLPRRDAEDL